MVDASIIVRTVVVLLKCLFIIYESLHGMWRQKTTHNTWRKFEVWYLFTIAVKIVILMFYDFGFQNINLLYTIYLINLSMNSASSYYLLGEELKMVG